jgi:glycyl-tRNA synthetase
LTECSWLFFLTSLKEEVLEDGSDKNSFINSISFSTNKSSDFTISEKRWFARICRKIIDDLKWDFNVAYDEKDSIGRRYRRQDAIGTPFVLQLTIKH